MTKTRLYICIFTFPTFLFCTPIGVKTCSNLLQRGNTKTVLAYARSPTTFTFLWNFNKDDGDFENNN